MSRNETPQLHHWLNTIAGQIDAAYSLTQEELYATTKILNDLLGRLDLGSRPAPQVLPTALIAEMNSRYWAVQLHSSDRVGRRATSARLLSDGDTVISIDAWRNALVSQLTSAYPTLNPIERVIITKTFDSLLDALGVQYRAPKYIPEAAVIHHIDTEGL